MFKYISKRMALAILTLFIILIFSYTMIIVFIDDPFLIASTNATDTKEQARFLDLSREYQAKPIIVKLAEYFSRFFQFDYGKIYFIPTNEKNIPDLFFKPLKWSVLVSLPAFVISAFIGVILGVSAGYKRGTIYDTIINIFVFIFIAIPSFIVAPTLINLFSKIGFEKRFIAPEQTGMTWLNTINSLVPAIVVMVLSSLAVYTLYARNQVITVLTSNYVLIAKTKGLSSGQIFRKYVFRNISIPLSAIIIPSYIGLLSGSIIIEKFWFIPGSSTIIAQAFPQGEINVVMFNIFFFTTLSLFTEIIVDVSYALIDPRIKYESSSGINVLELLRAHISRKKQIKELEKKLAATTNNNPSVESIN